MVKPRISAAQVFRCAIGTGLLAVFASATVAAPEFTPIAQAEVTFSASDGLDSLLAEKGLATAAGQSVTPQSTTPNTFVTRVRDKASNMVSTAMNFIGVPYRRGGTSADKGFDCSGFTRQVFESSLGLVLPRRADEQAKATGLVNIKRDELQPGDLVFFNTLRRTFSHVGIYLGEGKFIHAPRPGGEVRVEDMRFVYWAKRFTGARRAEPMLEQTTAEAQVAAPISTVAQIPTLR
jgi:cell wall-associated NlpC family hydrolase